MTFRDLLGNNELAVRLRSCVLANSSIIDSMLGFVSDLSLHCDLRSELLVLRECAREGALGCDASVRSKGYDKVGKRSGDVYVMSLKCTESGKCRL